MKNLRKSFEKIYVEILVNLYGLISHIIRPIIARSFGPLWAENKFEPLYFNVHYKCVSEVKLVYITCWFSGYYVLNNCYLVVKIFIFRITSHEILKSTLLYCVDIKIYLFGFQDFCELLRSPLYAFINRSSHVMEAWNPPPPQAFIASQYSRE